MWMSVPTPVTTRIMTAESGSALSPQAMETMAFPSACRTWNHVPPRCASTSGR